MVSQLAGEMCINRQTPSPEDCYFFCLNVVSFWFLDYVVEEFEGLADLG